MKGVRNLHRAFSLQWRRTCVATSAVLLLSGCFFDQLQRSEEQDIQRVQQKQATLEAEKSKSVTLTQQAQQLEAELSEREFTLSQLTERVQTINAENGRAIAENESRRLEYESLLAQVHHTNQQLAAARQNISVPSEQRLAMIESLNAELKRQVDALLR